MRGCSTVRATVSQTVAIRAAGTHRTLRRVSSPFSLGKRYKPTFSLSSVRSIEVGMWMSVIAHNVENLWRRLVLPRRDRQSALDQVSAAVGETADARPSMSHIILNLVTFSFWLELRGHLEPGNVPSARGARAVPRRLSAEEVSCCEVEGCRIFSKAEVGNPDNMQRRSVRAYAWMLFFSLYTPSVHPAEDQKPKEKEPPRDVVWERIETVYRFQNNGTGEIIQNVKVRVLTEAGLAASGQAYFA